MTSNLILWLYYSLGLLVQNAFADPPRTTIQLMEPAGGVSQLPVCPGLGTFYKYFNLLWPYLIGSAAGIAVLMAVVGGLQIIMSGGDQGKRQEGIDRFKNAILGLLMALFAGLILQTLNPSFYVPGTISSSGGC